MSDIHTVSGFIEEFAADRQFNESVLAALPEKDEYPPLVRSMFTIISSEAAPRWRPRVIAFGILDNGFADALPNWLPKFEGLLTRLMWCCAVLHIDTECSGTYKIEYQRSDPGYQSRPTTAGGTWEVRCYSPHEVPCRDLRAVLGRPGYTTRCRIWGYEERERQCIERMLRASLLARDFLHGRTKEDLASDMQLFVALAHLAHILSTNGKTVCDEIRAQAPTIPWEQVCWLRFELGGESSTLAQNVDRMWCSVSHLPQFIAGLKKLLRDLPPPTPSQT